MSNQNTNINNYQDEDMSPEYDFTNGVRGKHYQDYKYGHTVTIHYEDGTKTVENFPEDDNVIILDPDVKKYFPTSESVNSTLRNLIKLIPQS